MSRRKSFLGRHPYWIVFILAFGAAIGWFQHRRPYRSDSCKGKLHCIGITQAWPFIAVAVLAPITCYFRFFGKELDKATTPPRAYAC